MVKVSELTRASSNYNNLAHVAASQMQGDLSNSLEEAVKRLTQANLTSIAKLTSPTQDLLVQLQSPINWLRGQQ